MAILTSTDGEMQSRCLLFRGKSDSHILISKSFQIIHFLPHKVAMGVRPQHDIEGEMSKKKRKAEFHVSW